MQCEHRKPSSGDLVELDNDYFCCTWTIQDFCICSWCKSHYKDSDFILSEKFTTGADCENIWYLKLKPHWGRGGAYIRLDLNLEDCKETKLEVSINVSVLNCNSKKVNAEKVQIGLYKNENRTFCFEHKSTFEDKPCCQIMPNGKLTILCEILNAKPRVKIPNEPDIITNNSLSRDFKLLFDNEKFSDVTIIVGQHKFHVHKVILISRSPVFLAMFENDMKEKKENKIEICDMKHETVQKMLYYMYAGEFDHDIEDSAGDLLAAAEKYEIDELKTTCGKVLSKSVTIDNALEILILADLYKVNDLKNKALNLIVSHLKDMVESPMFKTVSKSYQHLVEKILITAAKK